MSAPPVLSTLLGDYASWPRTGASISTASRGSRSRSRTSPSSRIRRPCQRAPAAAARAWHDKHQALDTTPFGVEANRRNLEIAIEAVYRQRLIPRPFTVDELFDDVTRRLE